MGACRLGSTQLYLRREIYAVRSLFAATLLIGVSIALDVLMLARVSARERPAAPTVALPASVERENLAAQPGSGPVEVSEQRSEFAGFPILAGNTDIGLQFGAVATLTRFGELLPPYLWNLDLVLSTSIKDEGGALGFVQHNDVLRLDAPYLFGGIVRLDTLASFERTVNAGYYGLGDAAQVSVGDSPRNHEYLFQEGRTRSIARVHTGLPFDVAVGASARHVAPRAYNGSRLAGDSKAPVTDEAHFILGLQPSALFKLALGGIYDSRDSEFITRRGLYYQLGVAGTLGTSREHLRYAEASAVLAHFVPLGAVFGFALRGVMSVMLGRVPFYDLSQGGVFEPQRLLGGDSGVRGVPMGRYAGPIKAVLNAENRAVFQRFTFLAQRLRVGTTSFVDIGGVWGTHGIDSRGGTSLGPRYGVGAGLFLQWGDAAIFRIECAYSPDARSENPRLPVGIYVSDGLMF